MTVDHMGFSAFARQHLVVLALVVILVAVMSGVARGGRYPCLTWLQGSALGIALLLVYPLSLLAAHHSGVELNPGNFLPMHLCDWAAVTAFLALVWRHRLAVELTYFWGLAGSLQGLLTPDLHYGFPHPLFLVFFLHHAGVVIAALYLVIGLQLVPEKGAVLRVFLWTQGYALTAAILNLFLGTNYGFLSEKPSMPSLLDHMGPWPWYILSLQVLCLGLFLILDAPFCFMRRRRAEDGGSTVA